MPREMRLVDAESFAEKLRPLLRIAEKKADERAASTLTYVLDLLEDEPTLIIKAEKPKKDVVRHKYGEYKNVLLSDEEYGKLSEQFPKNLAERIERLSEYIAQKGDKYKSHYAVIRTWARQEKEAVESANGSFDTDEFFEAALSAARRTE